MNNTILVAYSSDIEKAAFYKKTYLHVALAILAFIITETLLVSLISEDTIISMVAGGKSWIFILGLFWLGSMLSSKWTISQSRSMQYLGLGFYVLIESLIFLPIISLIRLSEDGAMIFGQAAIITLALFIGLTGVAFTSKKDFSFLRNIIIIGGVLSLALIIAGSLFGFNLGLWFSIGMVILASICILYETQKLQFIYTTGQYVGASLQLFSSIMLLFWYVLRIVISSRK